MGRNVLQKDTTFIIGNGRLSIEHMLSLVIALLMTLASVLSLMNPDVIYPTNELRQSFFSNDVVNLVVGLPTLLGALWLAWRGKLVGLLLWPGALMYVLYNYLAYIFSMPASWYYLLLLAMIALSAYVLIGFMARLDVQNIGQHLARSVPDRFSGGLLIVFGGFVFLRVFFVIAASQADPSSVTTSELAILPADFLIAPAWIIGGILLWQRKPLGYVAGLGLLFQASMLFIGLIGILLLQPVLTGVPFDFVSAITVALMGLVCFIPFILYLRGIAVTSRQIQS